LDKEQILVKYTQFNDTFFEPLLLNRGSKATRKKPLVKKRGVILYAKG